MDPTPESLFAHHLAGNTQGDAGGGAEAAAFEALLAEHPEHADALRALRDDHGEVKSLFKRTRARVERDVSVQGKTIGDFRLVQLLGRGGMGEVWEAEQISLSRRVALKLLAPELAIQRGTDFFSREARAGARLNHPGIISVLGAGVDDGAHWIAMELVEGGYTLSAFLAEMRAESEVPEGYYRNVAEVVAKVAEAMEAAHQEGVIHRDLKPLNILITEEDEPKVGDFGLARLVDENSLSSTGDFAGTYYYMSPEQIAARRMGIDHRTDIFSLGIILYELLTLVRPFEGDTTHQIAQKILLREPRDPRTLRSKVPDDLAVICAKAMEKDPVERYSSMAEVAADLRRHNAHEPILAKPPGPLRRAAKWARRNPTKSAAGSIAAAAFVAISALAWQLQLKTDEANENAEQAALAASGMAVEKQRAEETAALLAEEKLEAEEARDEAEELAQFQASMLLELDSFRMGQTLLQGFEEGIAAQLKTERADDEEIKERVADFRELALRASPTEVAKRLLNEEILGGASDLVEEKHEDDPKTSAALRSALAKVYRGNGFLGEATENQERALEAHLNTRGEEHPDTLVAMNELGNILQEGARYEEAEPLHLKALEISRRLLGEAHPLTLSFTGDLGALYAAQGKGKEAEPLYRAAMEGRREALGDTHPVTLTSIMNMGYLLRALGKPEQGEAFMREALAGQRAVLGDEHRDTLTSIANLGGLMVEKGAYGEAEALLDEALSTRRLVLGDEHPETLFTTSNLGVLLVRQEKFDEATPLLRATLEGRRAAYGDTHPLTAQSVGSLGFVLHKQGKPTEALPYFREMAAGLRGALGDEHPETLRAINTLGTCLMQTGETEEAEGLLREALAGQRLALGDGHGWTMRSMSNLAKVLFERGELEEAEALAAELLELTPTEDPRRAPAGLFLESVRSAREGATPPTKDG